MAYFVGSARHPLPLPGGIGGVDGGMIGALIGLGTVEPASRIAGVSRYRGFAFWLPILPGAAAWVSLRRTVAFGGVTRTLLPWPRPHPRLPRPPPPAHRSTLHLPGRRPVAVTA